MKLTSHAHNLFEAFQKPGCPVCQLTLDSVHHFLDSVIYEYVNKPATHEAVRAARGFCPKHGWHIEDTLNASALGIAVLYEGVLRHMMDDMGAITPDSGRRQLSQAANALQARGECPACTHQRTVEEHLLRNLLEHIHQPEFADGFRQSAGLCLPHLRQLLGLPGLVTAKAQTINLQQAIWWELQAQLVEFRRKRDYRFAIEEMGEEGSSPRRSIEGLSGLKGLQ